MVIWKWKWNNLPTKRRINSPRNDIHFRSRCLCRPFSLFSVCVSVCCRPVAIFCMCHVALSVIIIISPTVPFLLFWFFFAFVLRSLTRVLCATTAELCRRRNLIWFISRRKRDEFVSNQCTNYEQFTHEISIINLAVCRLAKPSNW